MTDVSPVTHADAPATTAPAASPGAHDTKPAPSASRWRRIGRGAAPLSPVAIAVAFNLFVLRAELSPAAAPNDTSVHISMVHYVQQRISAGNNPFDGWYPRIQLGVALFHHYQSLAPIIAGLIATGLGAARTVHWTNYFLLSLWPICMYWTARLFGFNRWTAGATALVSPLVSSVTLYGYEHGSFTWIGNGVWAQLWGMWLLPLTLAFTWRAVSRGKGYALAALFFGALLATHFLTAYLAVLAIGLWVLIVPKEFVTRLKRAAVVGIGGALVASFVLVPLFADAKYSARTQYNTGTFWSDSWGFNRVMSWLFEGEIFDHGRWPVLSVLVAIGTLMCLWRFFRDERARALLGFMAVSLVLFCGRGPFGAVLNRIPGGEDLLLQRFIIGVHLGGIALAGLGLGVIGHFIFTGAQRVIPKVQPVAVMAVLLVIALGVLTPAWRNVAHYDWADAYNINYQKTVDATDGQNFTALADQAAAIGGGRIYAGSPATLDQDTKIGEVPAYIYLLDDDVDAIGFTLRIITLSSDIEVAFNPADLAQYNMFNVRYVILPADRRPLVRATLLSSAGRWRLYTVDTTGYLQVVDTSGTIDANRVNIGQQTAAYMAGPLPAEGVVPTLAFAGSAAPAPTAPDGKPAGSPGSVSVQYSLPDAGQFGGDVTTNREAVVMLKATYDPGWHVTVDGKSAKTEILAPSFVGVKVPSGTHRIAFTYENYPHYWLLFLVGALTLVVLAVVPRYLARKNRPRARPAASA